MEKVEKAVFWISLAVFIVSLVISASSWDGARNLDNIYLNPIEVEYAGENIIQNHEGQIYEYEYKFKTNEGVIFLHSDEPTTFLEEDFIRYNKDDTTDFEFDSEIQKKINKYKKTSIAANNTSIGALILNCVAVILYCISKVKQKNVSKKIEKKDKLWKEDIPKVEFFIAYNYPEYEKTIPLLNKIALLIKELDEFYANTKKEKSYRNSGLRKQVETIINLYINNIEIDEKFKDKIIQKSVNDEFYSNLERILSYINNEIKSLTKKNDDLLRKKFDIINSNAELDDKAIQYLAEKYEQN